MPKTIQAKDICDDVFLAAVEVAQERQAAAWGVTYAWAHVQGVEDVLVAAGVEAPRKVVLAKARSLIRRGLLVGCACGCRGDFEVVPQSEASG